VEAEEPIEVVIDPNEHAQFLWATEEEVRAGKVGDVKLTRTTDQQAATIRESFSTRESIARLGHTYFESLSIQEAIRPA
jgi:hypothetical protein